MAKDKMTVNPNIAQLTFRDVILPMFSKEACILLKHALRCRSSLLENHQGIKPVFTKSQDGRTLVDVLSCDPLGFLLLHRDGRRGDFSYDDLVLEYENKVKEISGKKSPDGKISYSVDEFTFWWARPEANDRMSDRLEELIDVFLAKL